MTELFKLSAAFQESAHILTIVARTVGKGSNSTGVLLELFSFRLLMHGGVGRHASLFSCISATTQLPNTEFNELDY